MLLALKRIFVHSWLSIGKLYISYWNMMSVQETLQRYAGLLMMLDSLSNIWSQHEISSWEISCELICWDRLFANRVHSNRLRSYVMALMAIGTIFLVLISFTDALQVLLRFWDRLLSLTSFWCAVLPVKTTHKRLSRYFSRIVGFATWLRPSYGFSNRSRYLQFDL